MVAADLQQVLNQAVNDVRAVSLRAITACRALVADGEWAAGQAEPDREAAVELARQVYQRCQERRRHCQDGDSLRCNSHLRCLALSVLKEWGDSAPTSDSELAALSKHWGRTALQFVLCAECADSSAAADVEQAQSCFDQAFVLLQRANGSGQVEVLEAHCMLKGWQAQLDWMRGDVRQVISRLEEAHAALELHGGSALLPQPRRYLAEHCAYSLAMTGFQASGGGATDDANHGGGGGVERRDLMRLLDLSISLLGDDMGDAQALRDRSLRLKAWLAMQEQELDLAAQTLNLHSREHGPADEHGAAGEAGEAGEAGDAEAMVVSGGGGGGGGGASEVPGGDHAQRLLKATLLFKSNQKAEASAHVLEWLSKAAAPYAFSRDALQLLQEHGCASAAVEGCTALLERYAQSQEEYSELVELKHRLLDGGREGGGAGGGGSTGGGGGGGGGGGAGEGGAAHDSAASASFLEAVIDAHCGEQRTLRASTLQTLGRRLWRAGARHFAGGDLHHGIERFERAARFLEQAEDLAGQLRTQSWLAYCYQLQDQPEKAKARAIAALRVAEAVAVRQPARGGGGGGGGAGGSGDDGGGGGALAVSAAVDDDAAMDVDDGAAGAASGLRPVTLTLLVLIKAHLKLGEADEAHARIGRLLEQQPGDHLMLAAVCQEVASMGGGASHATAEKILEHFVQQLDAMRMPPAHPPPAAALTTTTTAPPPPPKSKLVSATRSLILHREQNPRRAEAAVAGALAAKLLADVQLVAARLVQHGAEAVCDSPEDLEWLADKAFGLGLQCLLGSGSGSPSLPSPADGAALVKLDDVATLRRSVELLRASSELRERLQPSADGLAKTLTTQTLLCRQCLLLARFGGGGGVDARDPSAEAAARRDEQCAPLLATAARAVEAAFRAHARTARAREERPRQNVEAATLHVLQFEVAVARCDPSAPTLLARAADVDGVTATHLSHMGAMCLERRCPNLELGRIALGRALERLRAASPKDLNGIARLLRQQISTTTHASRHEAKKFFEVARDELDGYSAANCPMHEDELHWFAAHAWNRGLSLFHERQLEVAEGWMSMAFTFVNLSPALSEFRDEMGECYQSCLEQLSRADPREMSWHKRMSDIVVTWGVPSREPLTVAADRRR